MNRRAPLTADEAREIVRDMRAKTSRKAAAAFLKAALRIGNLSADATEIYSTELRRLETERP